MVRFNDRFVEDDEDDDGCIPADLVPADGAVTDVLSPTALVPSVLAVAATAAMYSV